MGKGEGSGPGEGLPVLKGLFSLTQQSSGQRLLLKKLPRGEEEEFYHVPEGREGPGLPHSVAPWGRRLGRPMASDQRDKLREQSLVELPMRSPHVSRTGSREWEKKHLGHSKEWSEG